MCLIALNWQPQSATPLVVAANRDEFYARPAAPLHRWAGSDMVAGRDRRAGGTWLGIARSGRFAAVTNYRLPGAVPAPRSRGRLPVDFVAGRDCSAAFAAKVWSERAAYGPFSLLVADRREMWFVSSHGRGAARVAPGCHALSNHLLDTPWPKVSRIRQRLRAAVDGGIAAGPLFELLSDTQPAGDDSLPEGLLDRDTERRLSAPFVRPVPVPGGGWYGTRCSTVLIAGARVSVVERNYDHQASLCGEIAWELAAC